MGKILEGLFDKRRPSKREIKTMLKKRRRGRVMGYVLISCYASEMEGKMEVEMQYEGDKWLTAYMIENAQEILEGELHG